MAAGKVGYSRGTMWTLLAAVLSISPARGEELPEARALYERAQASFRTRTASGLSESVRLFERAAAVDPDYAAAHAGVADSSCLLALYGFSAPNRVMPRAREAAAEAIRLDPDSAEAHAALGLVSYLYEWSFRDAGSAFEKAIELDPDYATAHHWYAMMLMASGRIEDALLQIDRTIALDPDSALYDVKRGTILIAAGNLDEAEEHLHRSLERHPDSALARRELGLVELMRGRPEEALVFIDALDGEPALRGYVLGVLGRTSEARAILFELENAEGYVSSIDVALVEAGLGEVEEALDSLDRALEERDAALVYLRTQPGFASLRSEPRFQKILSEVYR